MRLTATVAAATALTAGMAGPAQAAMAQSSAKSSPMTAATVTENEHVTVGRPSGALGSSGVTKASFANYWLVTSKGAAFGVGAAKNVRPSVKRLSGLVAGIAAVPDGAGFWLATRTGQIAAAGKLSPGSAARIKGLRVPVTGIAAAPDGAGYWLVARNGRVYARGQAQVFSCGQRVKLSGSVVGLAPTKDGGGYWLATAQGRVYPCGDARKLAFAAGTRRIRGVVGIAVTATGHGIWLVSGTGAIAAYGDARVFRASGPRLRHQHVVGLTVTASGGGYWLPASDGQVFAYGDAQPPRHAVRTRGAPVVGMATYLVISSPSTKVIAPTKTLAVTGPAGGTRKITLAAGATTVRAGQILVSGPTKQAPDGYLVKATSVTTANGVQTVTTKPATLFQAMPTGSFDYQGTLEPTTPGAAITDRSAWRWDPGVHRKLAAQIAHSDTPFSSQFSCTGEPKTTVSGSLNFDPTINLSSQWGVHWLLFIPVPVLESASFGAGVSEAATLNVSAQALAKCGTKKDGIDLITIPLPTIDIQLGPFPLVIAPSITINLAGSVGVTGALTVGVKQSASAFAEITYQNGNGFSTSSGSSSSFSDSLKVLGTLTADVSVSPTLKLLIYGLAGPTLDIGAGLTLTAKVGVPQPEPWWTLQGCLFAGVGIKIDLLDLNYSQPQLFKRCYTIATGDSSTVPKPPVITSTTLPSAQAGQSYRTPVGHSGGTDPLTWSATGLPTGLSINAGTGVISGTTRQSGTFKPGITITDSQIPSRTATGTVTLTVIPAPALKLTSATTGGTEGLPFSGSLTVAGGIRPYSWSATGLPAGWSIDPSTGAISGTVPSSAGQIVIAVTVTDHAVPAATAHGTLTINVSPGVSITTANLPGATENFGYDVTMSAEGGQAPYQWAASGLPDGLQIDPSSGEIQGTPTVTGTFDVTINLNDSGSPETFASEQYTLDVYRPVAITTTQQDLVNVGDERLCENEGGGTGAVCWQYQLQASGGSGCYVWSNPAMTVPSGLTFDPSTATFTDVIPPASQAYGNVTYIVSINLSDCSNPADITQTDFSFKYVFIPPT